MNTLARPYASAAFEYATEKNDVVAWNSMLEVAAVVSTHAMVVPLFLNHRLSEKQLAELFCDTLQSYLDMPRRNFIFILAGKNRLSLLSDIAILFHQHRQKSEKTLDVSLVSATELDETHRNKIIKALKARFQCEHIVLQSKVDPALLGGAIVYAGDRVMDGSVRGKLNRMIKFIR